MYMSQTVIKESYFLLAPFYSTDCTYVFMYQYMYIVHVHEYKFNVPMPLHHSRPQSELLAGLEVGPNLGMVKSSSLESLHNIVAHTIKRDVGPGAGELRARETRNSFRRAVDRSTNEGGSSQRGVDGEEGDSRGCL